MQRTLRSAPGANRLPLHPTNCNLRHHETSSYHSPYPNPPHHTLMDRPYPPTHPNHNHQTACVGWRDALFDLAFTTKSSVASDLMEVRPRTQVMRFDYRASFCRSARTGAGRVFQQRTTSPQAICISRRSIPGRKFGCRRWVQEETRCARRALYVYIIRKSAKMDWFRMDDVVVSI